MRVAAPAPPLAHPGSAPAGSPDPPRRRGPRGLPGSSAWPCRPGGSGVRAGRAAAAMGLCQPGTIGPRAPGLGPAPGHPRPAAGPGRRGKLVGLSGSARAGPGRGCGSRGRCCPAARPGPARKHASVGDPGRSRCVCGGRARSSSPARSLRGGHGCGAQAGARLREAAVRGRCGRGTAGVCVRSPRTRRSPPTLPTAGLRRPPRRCSQARDPGPVLTPQAGLRGLSRILPQGAGNRLPRGWPAGQGACARDAPRGTGCQPARRHGPLRSCCREAPRGRGLGAADGPEPPAPKEGMALKPTPRPGQLGQTWGPRATAQPGYWQVLQEGSSPETSQELHVPSPPLVTSRWGGQHGATGMEVAGEAPKAIPVGNRHPGEPCMQTPWGAVPTPRGPAGTSRP